MAAADRPVNEENFQCCICLELFTKPVSIPCGHNFCLDCITKHWDNKNAWKCPLCAETFISKPMLRVNTVIAQFTENVKKCALKKSCCSPEQAGNGNVLCDMCAGVKNVALKSCLDCFMSYCETHLERHQRNSVLKKHKLIHPVENLESRICKEHDKPLELFCRADEMLVCESCKGDHKTHEIVSLEDEAQLRKGQLLKKREDMDQMILVRQQKIHEIQPSLQASRKTAEKGLSHNTHVMTALVDYIKRSQAELAEVIQTKQKKNETETEVVIKELEGEIIQIEQNNLHLNQISLNDDAFTFLEKVLSLKLNPLQVREDWSDLNHMTDQQFAIQQALTKLEMTVTREIRMLCDPDLKEMQQYAVNVTLDPDTANPCLHVSEDRKQVTYRDRKRNFPPNPKRFDQVLNVLAKEGFSAGKFYYEVQVKDKTDWDLGVASRSINRKCDVKRSPRNGYWTIWMRKGREFTASASAMINLDVREIPQKVGVFVDYEEGRVSFYDADTKALIFPFTGCNFTEELFPVFSPCSNVDCKNSAPLIITPVKHNI